MFEEKLIEVVQNVCENFRCFNVKIGKPKIFVNDEGQTIYHSPILSSKLQFLHAKLKSEFEFAQLPYSTKYSEFKPHITIEYVNQGEERRFSHICPQGSWEVNSVWIWRN